MFSKAWSWVKKKVADVWLLATIANPATLASIDQEALDAIAESKTSAGAYVKTVVGVQETVKTTIQATFEFMKPLKTILILGAIVAVILLFFKLRLLPIKSEA